MTAALATELRRSLAARPPIVTRLLLVLGALTLVGSFTIAVAQGNEVIADRLGDLADAPPWRMLLGAAAQIVGAAAVLAESVVVSWAIGREFSDGTITGLFALPVSRARIALAKLAVALLGAIVAGLVLTAALLALGWALGFGLPGLAELEAAARVGALVPLSALIVTPAAIAATLGRGLLAGIALTVGLVASAQVAVVAGLGAAYPIAAPALWALEPATPHLVLLGPLAVGLVSAALTALAWRRLQLDR